MSGTSFSVYHTSVSEYFGKNQNKLAKDEMRVIYIHDCASVSQVHVVYSVVNRGRKPNCIKTRNII